MSQRHRWSYRSDSQSFIQLSIRYFWPICACAALVVLIGHRNITLGPSYIPTSLFSAFLEGINDPLGAYLYKLSDQAKDNFSGNPWVTAVSGLLAFTKPLLTLILVEGWTTLSRPKKLIATLVVAFPMVSGVSVGTNKPLFDVAFMLTTIIAALALTTPRQSRWEFIKARILLIFLSAFILASAVTYFQHAMDARAPGLEYARSLSATSGDGTSSLAKTISVKPGFQAYCENAEEWVTKGCHLLSIGTIYLTQGYYGMSLSIALPLETTYGIGHSRFITDSLKKYVEIDLAPRTFQYKIHSQWHATGQWHSAYSQWANDVGFWGVSLIMLALGFYVCAIWTSALATRHPAAICSIPLLLTMILFLPANNLVFNVLESLATFSILLIAWLASLLTSHRRHVVGVMN